MKYLLLFAILISFGDINAQYEFSGNIDQQRWHGSVYLSLVEDYRKFSGIYPEQIIAKVETDSAGFFSFKGDQLNQDSRIYRIHVDNCSGDTQLNHFSGSCPDNQQILFIAKNTDTIVFPFSFDDQMFCEIESRNEKSLALLKIDSIKEEMRFAYTGLRSEASSKLNNKKWFKTFQDYGRSLEEPLAELYIFAFLSDRSSEFHDFYLEDLKVNPYYVELKDRLVATYPNESNTIKYITEIESDMYAISSSRSAYPWYYYLILILLAVSVLVNIIVFIKPRIKRQSTGNLESLLTKQEQVVLDQILSEKSNKEIADSLFVSLSTVKTHINSIYKKLNVSSRDDVKSLFN